MFATRPNIAAWREHNSEFCQEGVASTDSRHFDRAAGGVGMLVVCTTISPAAKWGLLTSAQVHDCGLTRADPARLLRAGSWWRCQRGVFVTDLATLPEAALRRRAALLAAGPDAALSHSSALAEYGVETSDTRVHVSVLRTGTRTPEPSVALHRRRADRQVVKVGGVTAVVLDDAVLGSCQVLAPVEWRAVLCEVVRDRRTTASRLRGELERAVRLRGRAVVRSVLEMVEAGCQSPIELDYWELEQALGLPRGERQARLPGGRRGDVFYRFASLVVELDGRDFHSSDAARRADIRRDAELAALGILTLRFTGRQVRDEAEWVAHCVRSALASRTNRSA